jgi:hypothetical protein
MNQNQTESKPQDVEEPREEGLDETACSACGNDPFAWEAAKCAINMMQRDLDRTKDTMAKMKYNHQYEREKMARVIRRLVRYADLVAERHPKAVTIHGQNARVVGGIWLDEFDRQNELL